MIYGYMGFDCINPKMPDERRRKKVPKQNAVKTVLLWYAKFCSGILPERVIDLLHLRSVLPIQNILTSLPAETPSQSIHILKLQWHPVSLSTLQ